MSSGFDNSLYTKEKYLSSDRAKAMNDLPTPSEMIERIMQTAKAVLPESINNDVKENLRAAIQEVVNELDVVTREEFDIQKNVLMRTRMKVEQLEKVITDLEA